MTDGTVAEEEFLDKVDRLPSRNNGVPQAMSTTRSGRSVSWRRSVRRSHNSARTKKQELIVEVHEPSYPGHGVPPRCSAKRKWQFGSCVEQDDRCLSS